MGSTVANTSNHSMTCMAVIVSLFSAAGAWATEHSLADAVAASKPLVDVRLRHENVEQDPLAEEAQATTLRARLGFETGRFMQTALTVEGEFVTPFATDYNDTINGKTSYPIIADPESYEINRLQLANSAIPKTTVTLGRQRIVLDDHRFVGNVGWRQNEQTFDALRVVNTSLAKVMLDASYVRQVNRVFGKDSPQGRYESDSFLLNAAMQLPIGKLTAFGYWLDFEPIVLAPMAVRDSSTTYGLRLAGERPVHKIKLGYVASYATQDDYADNPIDYENGYYLAEVTASGSIFSVGAGLEVLEGDGAKGFATPLATLHKFQGWNDKFLTTPVNGIQDMYANIGATFKAVRFLDALALSVIYHSYEAERTRSDYGDELNVQLAAKIKKFTTTLKYGDYSAKDLFTDTRKYWVQVDYVW